MSTPWLSLGLPSSIGTRTLTGDFPRPRCPSTSPVATSWDSKTHMEPSSSSAKAVPCLLVSAPQLSSAPLPFPSSLRFTSDSSQDKGRSLRVSLRKIASFSQSTLQIHTLAELRGFHRSHMPLGQGGGTALLMFLPLLASGARTHTFP